MPIELQNLPDGGILYKGTGVVTSADIFPVDEKLYASDDRIRSLSYQIADLTDVDAFRVSAQEMEVLAFQDSRALHLNPSLRIAVVATNALTFGMNRVYEANVEPKFQDRVRVFNDLTRAQDWISSFSNSE